MAEVFEAIAEIDYLLDNDVNVAPTLEKRRKELMEGD